MPNAYDDAVTQLYRAPHDQFVPERKRLATELTAAGDKAAGALLSKRRRPTLPAWTVNQLWWSAREPFQKLLEQAARLRDGDLDAAEAHRKALAVLRTRAQKTLSGAGLPVNEATLRRITTTLSAIAAAGSFDPDPPGALSSEREAPGFDAFGATATFVSSKPSVKTPKHAAADLGRKKADDENGAGSATKARAAEKAAAARLEKERAKKQATTRATQKRLEASLRSVEARIETQERKLQQLRHDLRQAEAELEAEQSSREEYRARLAQLESE